jgi:hypothetical protein
MWQLIAAIVGLLADLIVYWAVPIIGAALFSAVSAIIIAVNPLVGAAVVIIIAAILVAYCLREGAVWQAVMWGSLLLPYGVMAIISPYWAVLWGLGISLLALGVLTIPGAVLPHGRGILTAALIAVIVLHTVLSFTVWSGGVIFLVVIGLLAVAAGSFLFSRGARPWEIRRVQRSTGRMTATVGLILIIVGLLAPRFSMPKLNISLPRPLVSAWEVIANHAEAAFESSKRSLLGERAKTEALESLKEDLRHQHRERWDKNIRNIPNAPLSPREWQELGVPDP